MDEWDYANIIIQIRRRKIYRVRRKVTFTFLRETDILFSSLNKTR